MSIFLFSYVLVAKIEEQKTCEYIAVFLWEPRLLKQIDVKLSKIVSKLQILPAKGYLTFH